MKMEKTVFYVSDCCNAESNVDHEICSQCGEHCEILTDDSMAKALKDNSMTMEEYDSLPDYIPGLDDGEGWDPIMGDAEDNVETDDEWLDDFYGEEDFA
jgi:hypothetical protein